MRKTDFGGGWRFRHPGEGWKVVTLPHDAMLADGRAKGEPTGSAGAYYRAGVYEYEKEISLPDGKDSGRLFLQFEGVMRNAKVYVNGVRAGGAAYGYIPFWVNLTKYAKKGKNTIEVIADNSEQPSSRWYTGGGIYRPVWLWEGGDAVIAPQGLRVRTLSYEKRQIVVSAQTLGTTDSGKSFSVLFEILDGSEKVLASAREPADPDTGLAETAVTVPGAELWDENTPSLYRCRATLFADGISCDRAGLSFGIRQISGSGEGFFVNGRPTLLRGGSVHHDNGVIGAVSTPESEMRRVRILKQQGFNALRIAHNPASEALLDACDRYGMYVIDETWDMWYSHKSAKDYAGQFEENYEHDIGELVARDYSHPSVIMYSIGNEVSEPASEKGLNLAREIIDRFHALDTTRPVTAGINIMILSQSAKGKAVYKEEGGLNGDADQKTRGMSSTLYNLIASMVGSSMNRMGNGKKADEVSSPVLDALDICGYNYASGRYPLEGKAHPGRLIYGSEIFPQDVAKNWKMVEEYPYLIGDFLWTAWDYAGECGLGAWSYDADGRGFDKPYPWKLADSGALDILGDPNGEMLWSRAAWGLEPGPKIAVRPVNHPGVKPAKAAWRGTDAIPSWSWNGCEGNKAVVEVYTGGAYAELRLNGEKIGRKKTKDCRAVFKTKYAPGALEAVAYDAKGNILGSDVLVSAEGKAWPESVIAREKCETPSEHETVYVEISLRAENGETERNADRTLRVRTEGCELLGFGSARPRTEEEFLSGEYRTYYGRALAAVRKKKGEKALVVIGGEGLEDSVLAL